MTYRATTSTMAVIRIRSCCRTETILTLLGVFYPTHVAVVVALRAHDGETSEPAVACRPDLVDREAARDGVADAVHVAVIRAAADRADASRLRIRALVAAAAAVRRHAEI